MYLGKTILLVFLRLEIRPFFFDEELVVVVDFTAPSTSMVAWSWVSPGVTDFFYFA